MSAIAGINQPNQNALVGEMLARMSHRGPAGSETRSGEKATLGLAWTHLQASVRVGFQHSFVAQDQPGSSYFASADGDTLALMRGPIGVSPLYYGVGTSGALCFATEVKGLLPATRDVHLLPPGCIYKDGKVDAYYALAKQPPLTEAPDVIAQELRRRLERAVERRIGDGNVGAWLSGGVDSSVMAALARPHVRQFHTFAAGLAGAPDLTHARQVADYLRADHHEVIPHQTGLIGTLPEVIYHLESFDALLVRSSIMNFLAAQLASQYVPAVFSGEGGDELFGGYDYLKTLEITTLPDELIDITARLHNTALQRVDRCSSAHGTVAYVGFLDMEVVDYALRIPPEYKIYDGMEKWILRQAMVGALPFEVLWRRKAKFWEGAGVGELLAEYAGEHISDGDFARERQLSNGWRLNSKEELMYYRIFREQFGDFADLSWMGRTKGAPVQ